MPLSTVLGAQSLVQPAVCTTATRPASPYTGQAIYDTTLAQTLVWSGTAWVVQTGGVVQVKNAGKADSFSTTSGTFVDVTDLTISITPTLATNKVLVVLTVQGAQVTGDGVFRLMRGATAIGISTVGSVLNGAGQVSSTYPNSMFTVVLSFLDSPATTSATTYKVQTVANGGTTYVNRRGTDASFGGFSSITVMEVLP